LRITAAKDKGRSYNKYNSCENYESSNIESFTLFFSISMEKNKDLDKNRTHDLKSICITKQQFANCIKIKQWIEKLK